MNDKRVSSDTIEAAVPAHAADLAAVQRRTLRVLVASQIFSGAGLAAGVTVGALLAQQMLGSSNLSGLPAALLTAGSAAAAVIVGSISNRFGRRPGLTAGYLTGALGGALVVAAAAADSLALLFPALFIYGSGTATNLQARYAGADLAHPTRRGSATSTVLVATTLGAVGGPLLVSVSGGLAIRFDLPRLSGPFLIAAVAYGVGALILATRLVPDPLLTARAAAERAATAHLAASPDLEFARLTGPRGAPTMSRNRKVGDVAGILLGATTMVITQLIMAAIMTMTPVHMHDHGLGLEVAGVVIAVHVGMMYLPSPLSGRLADRRGPRVAVLSGAACLLAAGALASMAPDDSTVLLALALGLLGLGWNLGLLGGTLLVTNAVVLAERARIQGRVDLAVALSGATGGLMSGMVMSSFSYSVLTLSGGLLALALLPAALRPAARAARVATSI